MYYAMNDEIRPKELNYVGTGRSNAINWMIVLALCVGNDLKAGQKKVVKPWRRGFLKCCCCCDGVRCCCCCCRLDIVLFGRNFGLATGLKSDFCFTAVINKISLGGRVLSAHRRQVKVPVSTRGKCSTRLVFHENTPDASVQAFDSNNNSSPEGQEQAKDAADLEYLGFAADSFLFGEDLAPATSSKGEQALHKRKREEDNGETDSDSDFYGYAADSLIFEQFPAFEDAFRESSSTSVKPVRSTKRKIKKRRKVDYLYY
nr:uncharacterized protein LOC115254665 [Aedes albopictus]